MRRVGIFLILGALILGLVGCSPGGGGIFGGYSITVSSTVGGTVTDPGEGVFRYPRGSVVNLVAAPDVGCRFVSWISTANSVADVNDATTTITMDNNYCLITAKFETCSECQ
jgi:hypothetical protein